MTTISEAGRADPRAARRAARRLASRTEILDAAELVFGEDGLRDGSLRRIADLSGYSTAAIYLFFDSKQHLVAETLNRRADEYLTDLRAAAAGDGPAMERLHRVVDVAAAFFTARPRFRALLRQLQGGAMITGPVLARFAGDVYGRYAAAMTLMTDLILDGQAEGDVRSGNAGALAHLASVLTNEYVLAEPGTTAEPALTSIEFHALFDGALRVAGKRRKR
jgi:AcrR family transcriptional regulator